MRPLPLVVTYRSGVPVVGRSEMIGAEGIPVPISMLARVIGLPVDDERPAAGREIDAVELRRPPLIAGVRAAAHGRKGGRVEDPAEDRHVGEDLLARAQADVVSGSLTCR